MNIQLSILKVLAGQPFGCSNISDLNRSLAVLDGREWAARMQRLSGRAPTLDIFGSKLVVRDDAGRWQITGAGRAILTSLEGSV